MYFRFLLCICLTIQIIHAKSEEEIRTWFVGRAMECNKEHPVTPDELLMLQKHKLPDSKNAKCLLACVFKKAKFVIEMYFERAMTNIELQRRFHLKIVDNGTNSIDDKGMFNMADAIAETTKNYENDDKKVENSKKLMEICQKVNTQEVADGDAGCDRSMLLLKCFKENGPGLGFHIHDE